MAISFPSVDVEYALVCEGVRREDNGKLFAYGIYGNNVLLREFPASVGFCLLMRIKPKRTGTFDLNVRVTLDDETLAEMRGKIESADASSETTPTPVLPVQITKPGVLEFSLSEVEGTWVSLVAMPVEKLG